ncbi:MAG: efflux RND transporter periplasmic adaptor subunit [Gemmatimonadetes bacterium]|nr:efflux RND transporter periplasmic adaptor subunit [Gemmatimonadota bacterium]
MSARRGGWAIVLVLVIAGTAGWLLGRAGDSKLAADSPGSEAGAESGEVWTCSMHPQIRLSHPGKCPICFMDLIPVKAGDAGDTSPVLTISPAARALAGIRTVEVVRDRPSVEVRLFGRVAVDETRTASETARVAGRLDRLYVDFTGIRVRSGDHLAEIYSPELLAAQQEYLQALRSRDTGSGGDFLREATRQTVKAARDKLSLFGLTDRQIESLEQRGQPSDHVTLYSHQGGIVVEKLATEGDYVKTGAVIYRISDLSRVWVLLDAYESDLSWLRWGQEIEFGTDAHPGRTFRGTISFVSPTLDPATRTAKVRVNVANERDALKPGMFVRATVYAEVDDHGDVISGVAPGQWMCPMHPEVVAQGPGTCEVCGMALVPAEKLGLVANPGDGKAPLVVPVPAVMFTGKRALVYVERDVDGAPGFEAREVTLGPRAGDSYVVLAGVEEGERVVAEGAFKIDSELQIRGRESLMSAPTAGIQAEPAAATSTTPPGDAAFAARLAPLYDAYFALWRALAADDEKAARAAAGKVAEAAAAVDVDDRAMSERRLWKEQSTRIAEALASADRADLAALRAAFQTVSAAVDEIEARFGHVGAAWVRTHCPMAFDFAGADWLQTQKEILNPYFGSEMLRCGSVTQERPAVAESGS